MTGPYRHDPAHIRALAVTAVRMLETDPTLSVHGVAANLGIPHSAVYTAWRRINPDHPPRGKGRISPQMRKAAALPFATLCDVMLDHVPSKPAPASEIFTATLRDYGVCCERRLYRALRRLIDTGRVERVGQNPESMYRRRTTTMTKKIDREQLKRTALAATQDEWQWQDDGDALEGVNDGQIVLYVDEDEDSDGPVVIASVTDRVHIAAASPPVVLALIAKIEELERERDALRPVVEAVAGASADQPIGSVRVFAVGDGITSRWLPVAAVEALRASKEGA